MNPTSKTLPAVSAHYRVPTQTTVSSKPQVTVYGAHECVPSIQIFNVSPLSVL